MDFSNESTGALYI